MENTRENVIKLLRAMIKSRRDRALDLEERHPDDANVIWAEQNALSIAADILEDQRDFDDYAAIYFNDFEEEEQSNG